MMPVLRLPLILSVAAVAGLPGCAGETHNYAAVTPQLDAAGKGRVVVATQDRRPYVVSADKPLSFVGITRTAVGLPVNVTTSSGHPLAVDWTDSICRALRRRGFEPVAVRVSPGESKSVTVERLCAAGGKAALLFTIRDWKSETYIETSVDYDAMLEVFDPAGGVIARSSVRGRDDLGAQGIDTGEYARRGALEAFQRKVQHLLNDPNVAKTLR